MSKEIVGNARYYWDLLVGKPEELTRLNRGFNVVSILLFLLLGVLIVIDFYLGFIAIAYALMFTQGIILLMYWLSRKYGKYKLGLQVYVGWSYPLISFVFFYNGGSLGPALYFFLLTYLLFIVFASKHLQRIALVLHIIFPIGLLLLEYFYPEFILGNYQSQQNRLIDIATSLPIIFLSIYFSTRFLRQAYEREREASELRSRQIERQSEFIKNQNQLLQEGNQEKLALISMLGHDLRSPLNAITGALEILLSDELEEGEGKDLEAELLLTARNTSDMLNNVLSWVLGQVKGIQPNIRAVSPIPVIRRVLDLQSFVAEKKGINLIVEKQTDANVLADLEMFELVMRNLMSNAIKFTPKGGEVKVGVFEDLEFGRLVVYVRDNGLGIPNHKINEIFKGQIQSTYGTDREKGIGLGLFLCKDLALKLKGALKVESNPGEGSTFYLSLPISIQETEITEENMVKYN